MDWVKNERKRESKFSVFFRVKLIILINGTKLGNNGQIFKYRFFQFLERFGFRKIFAPQPGADNVKKDLE